MAAWCGCGATGRAEAMVEYGGDNGVEVLDEVYEWLVVGRIREREIEAAHRCLSRMWDRDLVPGISVMNRMVGLYTETGRLDRAIEILSEMEGCGEDEGVPPDASTFMCVVCGLASMGDAARTRATLQRMADSLKIHPKDTYFRNLLIEAHCISGDMDAANALARGEDEGIVCPVEGCGCRGEADEESFALLAAGWTKKGAEEEAAGVMIGISGRGLDPQKVDMQDVVRQWHGGRRRQIKGFEINLDAPPPRLYRYQGVERVPGSGGSGAFGSQQRMLVDEDSFEDDDEETSTWQTPATTRGNSTATGRFSPLEGSVGGGGPGGGTATWRSDDGGSGRTWERGGRGRSADGEGEEEGWRESSGRWGREEEWGEGSGKMGDKKVSFEVR